MAKYNFTVSGSQLIVSLVPVLDDVQPTSMSYLAPSFKIGVGKINAYEYGQPKQSFLFTEIGEIDGVEPTDLQDAFDKLTTATANFNGGGAAPQNTTTQQTTQTSGTNPTPDTEDDLYVIHEAGVTASLTIPFPANPRNAQQFYIHSVGGITTLTLTAVVGTILSIATTITAGATIGWIYNQGSNKWYKIK
jgi:hypothetical protein